jgi:hypothetical protein
VKHFVNFCRILLKYAVTGGASRGVHLYSPISGSCLQDKTACVPDVERSESLAEG